MPITRTLTLTIAVLYLVCAAIIGTALSAGRVMAGGGVIAFTSNREVGNLEIFLVDFDRNLLNNFTNHPTNEMSPAWSPDGARMAFISDRDGSMEIYVVDLDGGNLRRLTNTVADERFLSWSPDSKQILFFAMIYEELKFDIYVIDTDGTNLQKLSESSWVDWTDGPPAWSPNGQQIAFAVAYDGSFEIDVMNYDGNNRQQLIGEDTIPESGEVAVIHSPAWSPDGREMAFVSSLPVGYYEIYVLDMYNGSLRRLTDNLVGDQQPVWSPDGQKIAFTSARDGNLEIYVMNADGSNPQRLTFNFADDFSPTWMP